MDNVKCDNVILLNRGTSDESVIYMRMFNNGQSLTQDLPVIPVSSLQALAQAAYRLTGLQQVTAVLDARMQEVYIANFSIDEHGIMQAVDEEKC